MEIHEKFRDALRRYDFNGIGMVISSEERITPHINSIIINTIGGKSVGLFVDRDEFNTRMTILTLDAAQSTTTPKMTVGEVAFNKSELIYPLRCQVTQSFRIIKLKCDADFDKLVDFCAKTMFYVTNNIFKLYINTGRLQGSLAPNDPLLAQYANVPIVENIINMPQNNSTNKPNSDDLDPYGIN